MQIRRDKNRNVADEAKMRLLSCTKQNKKKKKIGCDFFFFLKEPTFASETYRSVKFFLFFFFLMTMK